MHSWVLGADSIRRTSDVSFHEPVSRRDRKPAAEIHEHVLAIMEKVAATSERDWEREKDGGDGERDKEREHESKKREGRGGRGSDRKSDREGEREMQKCSVSDCPCSGPFRAQLGKHSAATSGRCAGKRYLRLHFLNLQLADGATGFSCCSCFALWSYPNASPNPRAGALAAPQRKADASRRLSSQSTPASPADSPMVSPDGRC